MAAYTPVSVPKQSSNQGQPFGKKNIIVLFKMDDVVTFTKGDDEITISALALKATAKPIGLFVDEATIDGKDTVEGEDYARGFIHDLVFTHPGNDVNFRALKNAMINEDMGAIVIPCDPAILSADVFGTPCAPLKWTKSDSTSNKDATKSEVELKSSLRGAPIGSILKTVIPETDNDTINTYLGLSAGGA